MSQDSGITMPKNQITHFCCQNDVNFYPKSLTSSGIFGIRGEKLNRLSASWQDYLDTSY